jgi:heparanase 1
MGPFLSYSHLVCLAFIGQWDSSNARDLLAYSIKAGYRIHGLELGNELNKAVTGVKHAEHFHGLTALLRKLYPDASTRPKVCIVAGYFLLRLKWPLRIPDILLPE